MPLSSGVVPAHSAVAESVRGWTADIPERPEGLSFVYLSPSALCLSLRTSSHHHARSGSQDLAWLA
jgi:hypothetical protein